MPQRVLYFSLKNLLISFLLWGQAGRITAAGRQVRSCLFCLRRLYGRIPRSAHGLCPHGHAPGMSIQSLCLCKGGYVADHLCQSVRCIILCTGISLRNHPPKVAGKSGCPSCWQSMVGSGEIIAQSFRTVLSKKDRTGVGWSPDSQTGSPRISPGVQELSR